MAALAPQISLRVWVAGCSVFLTDSPVLGWWVVSRDLSLVLCVTSVQCWFAQYSECCCLWMGRRQPAASGVLNPRGCGVLESSLGTRRWMCSIRCVLRRLNFGSVVPPGRVVMVHEKPAANWNIVKGKWIPECTRCSHQRAGLGHRVRVVAQGKRAQLCWIHMRSHVPVS